MRILTAIMIVCVLLTCPGCGMDAPAELTESPVLTEPEESFRLATVEKMLANISLTKTTAPIMVGYQLDTEPYYFYGANVAQAMMERESNPIALFHNLVDQGLYVREEQSDGFAAQVRRYSDEEKEAAFRPIPDVLCWDEREETDAETLLCEVLRMSSFVEENAGMSAALLNVYENTTVDTFEYSPDDKCYYNYSIECNGYSHAHILAVYLREPTDTYGHFNDVEIQFMRLYFRDACYAGASWAAEYAEQDWETQTAAIICSLEKLMAGESILDQVEVSTSFYDECALYQLPGSYELGEYKVEISSAKYDCPLADDGFSYEGALLVNYRIRR